MTNNQPVETLDFASFKSKVGKYEVDVVKLDLAYRLHDPRSWTAIINPGKENLIVTYFINRSDYRDRSFDVLSSGRNILDIDPEDVYQTIELLTKKTQD